MRSEWLQCTILRAASILVPSDQRAEWLHGWQSELWYITRRGATLFCLGAFRDALWLRRNSVSPVKRSRIRLESPLNCLAFLTTGAAMSVFIALRLPTPHLTPPLHLRAGDLTADYIATLMLSFAYLLALRMAIGRAAANPQPVSWRGRLRLWIFLGLKIALVQPIMFCGLAVMLVIGPVVPVAPHLGVVAIWFLTLRWIFTDQQRRCPLCLRLAIDPVRIGTPSQTFLGWYGSESMCPRGHGLLHVSEMSASYSENPHWLYLDNSWRSLFVGSAGRRQS